MMNDINQFIAELEAEYDIDEGFLGLLRGGHFDSLARDRFLRLLDSIDVGATATIDRGLVRLLWYVPLFMEWQRERMDDGEKVALAAAVDQVTNRLERILGVP